MSTMRFVDVPNSCAMSQNDYSHICKYHINKDYLMLLFGQWATPVFVVLMIATSPSDR